MTEIKMYLHAIAVSNQHLFVLAYVKYFAKPPLGTIAKSRGN